MKLSEPQTSVIDLLNRRFSVQSMLTELGWARSRLYKVMDELTEIGLLRAMSELPDGAKTETDPPTLWIDGCALSFPLLGWDDAVVKRLLRERSRFGQFPPEADDRYGYSRTEWTGHGTRRVEWGDWVVQGLLLPRLDGRYWIKATPDFRAVSLNDMPLLDQDKDGHLCWLTRGRIVSMDQVRRHRRVDLVAASPAEVAGLTMTVAWVMESRALLDLEALRVLA